MIICSVAMRPPGIAAPSNAVRQIPTWPMTQPASPSSPMSFRALDQSRHKARDTFAAAPRVPRRIEHPGARVKPSYQKAADVAQIVEQARGGVARGHDAGHDTRSRDDHPAAVTKSQSGRLNASPSRRNGPGDGTRRGFRGHFVSNRRATPPSSCSLPLQNSVTF